MTPIRDDVLTPPQRERAAAAYEAARMILGEDPPADEVIAVASWIVTGRGVTNIKVMPSEDLIQQVIARVSQSVQTGIDTVVGGDSARYRPPVGGDEIELGDLSTNPAPTKEPDGG